MNRLTEDRDLLDVVEDQTVLPRPVDVVELVLDVLVDHHQLDHLALHLQHNLLMKQIISGS